MQRFETYLSRSPRVEALNSASANPGSILHHARGTQVHAQLRALAEELVMALGAERSAGLRAPASGAPSAPGGTPFGGLKRALLRGFGPG